MKHALLELSTPLGQFQERYQDILILSTWADAVGSLLCIVSPLRVMFLCTLHSALFTPLINSMVNGGRFVKPTAFPRVSEPQLPYLCPHGMSLEITISMHGRSLRSISIRAVIPCGSYGGVAEE